MEELSSLLSQKALLSAEKMELEDKCHLLYLCPSQGLSEQKDQDVCWDRELSVSSRTLTSCRGFPLSL